MGSLTLKQAITEIHQSLDQSKKRKAPSPFFFMVGAGISSPSIPLAAQIQEHCIAAAAAYGKTGPPPSESAIDCYSYWFEQAYPQPEDRQHYLRERMQNAVISRANFRLAHLLLDSTIPNLIVTTNFDDFLSRALTLFGRRHVVCDHPATLARIDLRSDVVQIIHVHGSYWFYDCCNLRGEIDGRARDSKDTSLTMLSVLDDLLRTRSPLVVGYSGWEGDVFMTALQRRLTQSLRTNLYWFCYRRSEADQMPPWLSQNSNVRLVVAEEEPERIQMAKRDAGLPAIPDIAEYSASREAYALPGTDRSDPVLKATSVFDGLIQIFDVALPPLTKDPLGFFAQQLETSLISAQQDDPEDAVADVYAIRSVIERLHKARISESQQPLPSNTEVLLERFRNAIRQADHRAAIQVAGESSIENLTEDQLREISSSLIDAALALDDNSSEELASYDLVVLAVDRLQTKDVASIADMRRAARALVNKGFTLGTLNRGEEAIAAYDEVLRRFGEAPEPALREPVAWALVNKGVTLGTLNRSEEAIAVNDEVLRRFGEAPEPALREQVAWALVAKGFRLGTLNRSEEAIGVYDEVLRRFGEATEPVLREQVAMALVNKGFRLGTLNRGEEAMAAYDEVLRRFGEAPEPVLREQVARAKAGIERLSQT